MVEKREKSIQNNWNFGVAGARVGLKIQRTEVRFPEVPLIALVRKLAKRPHLGCGDFSLSVRLRLEAQCSISIMVIMSHCLCEHSSSILECCSKNRGISPLPDKE